MIRYKVTANYSDGTMYIEDDNIAPGSVPVNIPDSDKLKKQLLSLYLHVADIEEALGYLFCISADKTYIVNRALFVSALVCMIKCFQSSHACSALSEKGFKKQFPDQYEIYTEFKDWRNKHFVHDENGMREATAFLIVAPEGSDHVLGGPPSVLWERVNLDFTKEGRRMEQVLQAMWKYAEKQFDDTADRITEHYSDKTREELLTFPKGSLTAASRKSPNLPR